MREQLSPIELQATLPRQRSRNFRPSRPGPSSPRRSRSPSPLRAGRSLQPACWAKPECRVHTPVLLDAAALGIAGTPLLLHILFTKIHVQLIASFRARVCIPTGGKRAAQCKRPAGAPLRWCVRRGDPAPLSSGLMSLLRVSSASKSSPREGGAGRGQCPPRGYCPLYVPLRACEEQRGAR